MNKTIRIGTRNSQLALWQAHLVQSKLTALNYRTEIVEVSSTGDEVLDKPLHKIGGFGLFTKTLDDALLQDKIDIAVHSFKDVPTDLPAGIVTAAILERGNYRDVLVYNQEVLEIDSDVENTIATGSLRRTAQWLNKFPKHKVVDLRGNVNTRLNKLFNSDWHGAIFAAAGLQRIDVLPENHRILDWMIPAPAQGAVMVASRREDGILEACAQIHCTDTAKAVHIERQFMKTLEGGCTAPIGALALLKSDKITFDGILIDLDGQTKIEIQQITNVQKWENFGKECAEEILRMGGADLMKKIKNQMPK